MQKISNGSLVKVKRLDIECWEQFDLRANDPTGFGGEFADALADQLIAEAPVGEDIG